jgi:hypothetical protein
VVLSSETCYSLESLYGIANAVDSPDLAQPFEYTHPSGLRNEWNTVSCCKAMLSDVAKEAVATSLRSLNHYEALPAVEARTFLHVLPRSVMKLASKNRAAIAESSDTRCRELGHGRQPHRAGHPAPPHRRPPDAAVQGLLESHKSRLADTHGAGMDSAQDSVFTEWRDLKRRAREQEPLRAQLQAKKSRRTTFRPESWLRKAT